HRLPEDAARAGPSRPGAQPRGRKAAARARLAAAGEAQGLRRAFAALAIFCVAAVLASSGDIRTAELPPEARQALEQIKAGGPFSYPNDGRTFGNREAHLPKREQIGRASCRERVEVAVVAGALKKKKEEVEAMQGQENSNV